jgi:transcription elongation factor S-II
MFKISSPDQFRANIRSKLADKIGAQDSADQNIATNLEKGVFNYAIKEARRRKIVKKWENQSFQQLYVDHLRSIFCNLDTSPNIITQLKQKELTPETLAFMTHQEFDPAHWKILIDRKIKRDESKFVKNIHASTDMFTCKKCKSKKCTYYELQTRSADEPATIFITCLDCGKNWKKS